jgi:membrane protein
MTLEERMEMWWNIDESQCCCFKRWALVLFKRIYITIEHFINNNLGSYASALTYNTTLAVVPVLAIIFAIARGFGFDNLIEGRLRSALASFSPEMTEMVLDFVERYLQHTKSGVFLGFGLLLLFYTLVNLTSNIETAFNTVWQVTNSRNIYRRITDYISVFLLLPILMIITNGLNVVMLALETWFEVTLSMGSTFHVVVVMLPVFVSSLVFVLLYKLMPNTHVRWTACIGPGIIAGLLFLGLEYFYIHYQIKLSSYNAIYGSFAAIPLLLIFIQFTWYICLIGCQLTYANQMVREYAFERSTRGMSRRFRDTLSILLVRHISKGFAEGKRPQSQQELSHATRLPSALVSVLLEELVSVGVLAVTYNNSGTEMLYTPAVDIHKLTVRMVVSKLDARGTEDFSPSWMLHNSEWKHIRHYRYYDVDDALILDI